MFIRKRTRYPLATPEQVWAILEFGEPAFLGLTDGNTFTYTDAQGTHTTRSFLIVSDEYQPRAAQE